MTDSPTGLLDRLGPLGFLVLFVVLAAVLAVVNNPPAGERPPATVGAPAGTSGVAVEESGDYPATVAELETATTPFPPTTGVSHVTGEGGAATAVETGSVSDPPQAPDDASGEAAGTTSKTPSVTAQPVAPASETAINGRAESPATTPAESAATSVSGAGTNATTEIPAVEKNPGSPPPPGEAPTASTGLNRWVIGDNALQLASRARAVTDLQSLFEPGTAKIADAARTGLVEFIDALASNPSLAIGIAARLDEELGVTGFPEAERRAQALRGYFVDHGIDPGRIVAGVLVPDYESDDGTTRPVEFFFAERAE